jgi:hypothetical protein
MSVGRRRTREINRALSQEHRQDKKVRLREKEGGGFVKKSWKEKKEEETTQIGARIGGAPLARVDWG